MTGWLPLEESALDLYEHAPCGYVSTDPDWLILRVNQTFLDWTGFRAEELIGVKRLPDLLTVGGRIYHETHCAPLLRMQDAIREIAVDIVCADGRRLPTLVNSVLKRDDAGEPLLIRSTVFDATDRRRYEQELLAARDRERAAREHTERLQRLSRALVSAADTGAVARAVGDELVATFAPDRAGFAIRDEDGRLRPVFEHGGAGSVPPAGSDVFDEGAEGQRGALVRLPVGAEHSDGIVWMAFDAPRALAEDERALLVAFTRQATVALERAGVYEAQRDVAHVLQRSMLGGSPPPDPRFEIATHYEPAGEQLEVGGDWYDAFAVPGGRVAIVVGDVVGRGLVAASAMGQLRSAVRALAGTGIGPGEVLTKLDTFVDQVPPAQYATLVYAEIDPVDGSVCFACAGHLPPLLLDGSPRFLMEGRSPPLGSLPAGKGRSQSAHALAPGTGLLLYTDGLVERRGESIDVGLDRLVAAVGSRAPHRPGELVDRLSATLLPPAADDDVCLLCFVRR